MLSPGQGRKNEFVLLISAPRNFWPSMRQFEENSKDNNNNNKKMIPER